MSLLWACCGLAVGLLWACCWLAVGLLWACMLDVRNVKTNTVVRLFPVAVCLFPCDGLPSGFPSSLFFGSGLFFSFGCAVSGHKLAKSPSHVAMRPFTAVGVLISILVCLLPVQYACFLVSGSFSSFKNCCFFR